MNFFRNKRKWKVGFMVVSILAVVALFLGVTTPALAQDNPTRPTPDGANLELFYARELLIADRQAEALNRASEAIIRVESLITRLQGEGLDTAELEVALDAYRRDVASAQTAHDEAVVILNAHVGFDNDGQVTDFAQALETVRQAGRFLRDAHLKLRSGNLDLRLALREWRSTHVPQ